MTLSLSGNSVSKEDVPPEKLLLVYCLSLEDHSDTLSLWTWLRNESIIGQINISFPNCIEELQIVPTEDSCDREEYLCFRQTV